MSAESDPVSVITSLQTMERRAAESGNADLSIAYLRIALDRGAAQSLYGSRLLVCSSTLFVRGVDRAANEMWYLREGGYSVVGTVDSLHYLSVPEVSVHGLVLHFAEPELFGTRGSLVDNPRDYSAQVPVLAIASCMRAEVA